MKFNELCYLTSKNISNNVLSTAREHSYRLGPIQTARVEARRPTPAAVGLYTESVRRPTRAAVGLFTELAYYRVVRVPTRVGTRIMRCKYLNCGSGFI